LSLVKVVSITSFEIEGKLGVRLDMTTIEPPVIRGQSPSSDEEYVSDMAFKVMSGLQQTGIFPKSHNPRLSLYLTMEEYASLGKPLINDVLEMTVSKSKIELIPVGQQ
jgi:hypothetical protein